MGKGRKEWEEDVSREEDVAGRGRKGVGGGCG